MADANGDTGSELYETVADKMLLEAQNQNKSRKLQTKLTIFYAICLNSCFIFQPHPV